MSKEIHPNPYVPPYLDQEEKEERSDQTWQTIEQNTIKFLIGLLLVASFGFIPAILIFLGALIFCWLLQKLSK